MNWWAIAGAIELAAILVAVITLTAARGVRDVVGAFVLASLVLWTVVGIMALIAVGLGETVS